MPQHNHQTNDHCCVNGKPKKKASKKVVRKR